MNGILRSARLALPVILLSAGCGVGPAYERPEAVDTPPAYVATAAGTETPAPEYDWWRAFGSAELDTLVREALDAGPDLAAAAARVMEARAAVRAAGASRLPTVDLGGSASRSKMSLANFGMGSRLAESYNASATAAYEIDLWGRLSANRRSAWAGLMAGEAERRAVKQALISGVVRAWLGAREAAQQLELSESMLESYRRNLAMVEDRYDSGVVSAADIHMARQNVAAAAAGRDQLEQDMLNARYALEILVGRYPAGEAAAEGEDLAALPQLPPVPAGLPSDLMQRRPDIIAAEMRLVSANAAIGVAKADLFPRLALTGSAGYTSPELGELFKDASSIWNLAANLSMPLLNRGARTAQVTAAEARTDQARAAYVSAVLAGFRDVESALVADRQQAERRAHLRESVTHARRSLDIAESRYARGLDPLLNVLESQRRYDQARSDLLRAERFCREARVNLVLALGGDWDVSTETESTD